MAIYSSVPPPSQQASASAGAVNIEAWTIQALESLSVSPSVVGTGVTLSIPLGDAATRREEEGKLKIKEGSKERSARKVENVKRERDSLRRRELLLKGKEGSRRRQRWENDHLLHVPNAQPPLPSDWSPQPTHTVQNVPYYLAPLWDAGIRHRAEEAAAKKQTSSNLKNGYSATQQSKGRVPSDLRQKMKRSKGAKTLLQDLEQEVRKFVKDYHSQTSRPKSSSSSSSSFAHIDGDSDDEEIVFIGRDAHGNGITMSDEVKQVMEEELEREKLVYESLVSHPEGGFARWLVHCVAGYYGLSSRSVTKGMWREAYVGMKMRSGGELGEEGEGRELPRPLWGLI